jgi:hypothetical protein
MFPEAIPVEGVAPEMAVLKGATTDPEVPVDPEPTEAVHDGPLPEASMDVVVRSPEIQDAELIRLASMSEGAPTSRGGLELLSDNLIDPATVARTWRQCAGPSCG